MPTTITTGTGSTGAGTEVIVTVDTAISQDLEHDDDGTSWSTVCPTSTATISLVGANSHITIVNTNEVRIQPTTVAHVATQTFFVRQDSSPYMTRDTAFSVATVGECASKTWRTITPA